MLWKYGYYDTYLYSNIIIVFFCNFAARNVRHAQLYACFDHSYNKYSLIDSFVIFSNMSHPLISSLQAWIIYKQQLAGGISMNFLWFFDYYLLILLLSIISAQNLVLAREWGTILSCKVTYNWDFNCD